MYALLLGRYSFCLGKHKLGSAAINYQRLTSLNNEVHVE